MEKKIRSKIWTTLRRGILLSLAGLSKTVHLISDLCHDLFQLKRYILNQVEIGMKFYQSKPSFYLMTDGINPNFRIDIVEMVLNICKVQINPAVIYAHNQILQ